MRRIAATTLLALTLCGCMAGAEYKRPLVETPQSWRFGEKEARDIINTAWWQQFNDPVLTELIGTALRENKDLKIAAARIEEYVGKYAVTRATLFPQVNANAGLERERTTELGQEPIPAGTPNPFYQYQASLSASWEIDLWGKLRYTTEAAHAALLSTEEGRQSVILSLVTSVANAYVNLRDLDQQLDIARKTAKIREESYHIFNIRFKAGYVSELELSQAKSDLEQVLSTIPPLEKSIAQQENALSILLGRNPGPIPRGKSITDLGMPAIPAGLPSDLLAQRPDIRQAEQNLISASAQIGAVRAQYFPDISLTGLFGYESTKLSSLFSGPARTWNWVVPLTAPIFTGGAIAGQVKEAEAIQKETVLQYQQVIQNAFRDVEDSLADQQHTRQQLEALKRQVEALRTYARMASLRYDNGYTSYIEVLDADRSLFSAELNYTQTQGALFQSLVNLYKAMGGGWLVAADKLSKP
ncbi:MAG: efflux transporter outer membrane subunit [Dissulfurispiraceae bacterium]|jgi:multidrug efflux system outer membrane protein